MSKPTTDHKLNQESLEALLIAAARAKNDKNLHIALPLAWVFTPWVLDQLPIEIREPWRFINEA